MKIIIEVKDVRLEVSETGLADRTATMKYTDQNKQIQETLKVMIEQVIKLKAVVKE